MHRHPNEPDEAIWAMRRDGNPGSWVGCPVRDKDGRAGKIVDDCNGVTRYLDIAFDDGTSYTLKLNNLSRNPPDPLGIEWEWNPGKWGRISD